MNPSLNMDDVNQSPVVSSPFPLKPKNRSIPSNAEPKAANIHDTPCSHFYRFNALQITFLVTTTPFSFASLIGESHLGASLTSLNISSYFEVK